VKAVSAWVQENCQHVTRRRWLAVLAHAKRNVLERHAAWPVEYPFEWLRMPEVGLTMVRARIAGNGDRFNLGERRPFGPGQVVVGIFYGDEVRDVVAACCVSLGGAAAGAAHEPAQCPAPT
jgi:hypothetical protein